MWVDSGRSPAALFRPIGGASTCGVTSTSQTAGMRTRMSGGVAGDQRGNSPAPMPILSGELLPFRFFASLNPLVRQCHLRLHAVLVGRARLVRVGPSVRRACDLTVEPLWSASRAAGRRIQLSDSGLDVVKCPRPDPHFLRGAAGNDVGDLEIVTNSVSLFRSTGRVQPCKTAAAR